ncbi:uncharacterized protein LOC142339564 isoform X2 [Convolutriloba macropyga]|uniref:uncharacterized protein LOC142339564 isoform X2 n=1 Tax=Convolutriloba macropyga TaxID=536237 RepID=UPI003F51CB07
MADEVDGVLSSSSSSTATAACIKSRSLLWGRMLVATSTSEKPVATSLFSEKICVLNMGMFLQFKTADGTSTESETHALSSTSNRIDLLPNNVYGVVIRIRKNANLCIFMAQKGNITRCNGNWSRRTFLHSYWSESSIVMWYLVLKSRIDSSSLAQDSCVTVLPKCASRKALLRTISTLILQKDLLSVLACALLTNSENSAITSFLPSLFVTETSLPSVAENTSEFIRKLDLQLKEVRIVLKRCYPVASLGTQPYSDYDRLLWFNIQFETNDKLDGTALQRRNPMTDVHFLSLVGTGKYLLEEQMFGSTLSYHVPLKLLSAFINHFQYVYKLMYNLLKLDQTNNVEVLRRTQQQTVDFLREAFANLMAGMDTSSYLKKSDWKNDKWSASIPLNLQTYRVKLYELKMQQDLETMDTIAEQSENGFCVITTPQERKSENRYWDEPTELEKKELKSWEIVTVGCPTPHALDCSGTGRGLVRFEELVRLQGETVRQLLKVNPEHRDLKLPFTTYGLAFTDVFIRRDILSLSLILTPLCVGLARALETCKDDLIFWKILLTHKVNFSWTSLINDNGSELDMLRDFVAAVDYVNRFVKFVFYEGDNGLFPDIEVDITGTIFIRFPVPYNANLTDKRSAFMHTVRREGKEFQLDCCVHFLNQRLIPAPAGADATGASNAFGATGKLSTIQNDIFKQVHKTFVESHLKDTIGILNYTYGQTDDLKRLQNSGDKLRSLLKSADYLEKSARFPPAIDHVEEFMTASRLSRCIRLVNCKSAKDRTSVMATWEMSHQITEFLDTFQKSSRFQNREDMRTVIVDSLRRGVRLRNCKMNVGQPRYKFTGINMRLMPEELKPPEGTFTGSATVAT